MSRPKPASVVLSPLLLVVLLMLVHHQHHRTEARFVASGAPLIPSICKKPPPRSEGVCATEIEGYYYEPSDLDCKIYKIGACHVKRGQSFGSLQDCISTCIHGRSRNHDYYVNA